MPLWSFPAVVTGLAHPYVGVTCDLGARIYVDVAVRVVGVAANVTNEAKMAAVVPVGTPVIVTCRQLTTEPVKAHLTLADGRDVACIVKGRPSCLPPEAEYGGTLAKVWTYPATVDKVVDGDTAHFRLETGLQGMAYRTSVRVAHINAPEVSTQQGQDAKLWAQTTLTPGLPVTVRSHELDKYGRLLATVALPGDADYATEILAAGLAVPYEGGAK